MPLNFKFPEMFRDHAKIKQKIKTISSEFDENASSKKLDRKQFPSFSDNRMFAKKVKSLESSYLSKKSSIAVHRHQHKKPDPIDLIDTHASFVSSNEPSKYFAQVFIQETNLKIPLNQKNQTKLAGIKLKSILS